MRSTFRPQLSGEATLLAAWGALAAASPGAHLRSTQTTIAAVFPQWDPLNNAILLVPPSTASASSAAAELGGIYADVGVSSWALWVPSALPRLDGPDTFVNVDTMAR